MLLYLPALALSLLLLLAIARRLCSAPAARTLHAGLVLLAVAVGAELAGAVTTRADGSWGWSYDLTVAVEEAAESAGWLLVATAVACAAFAGVAGAGLLGRPGGGVAEPTA